MGRPTRAPDLIGQGQRQGQARRQGQRRVSSRKAVGRSSPKRNGRVGTALR